MKNGMYSKEKCYIKLIEDEQELIYVLNPITRLFELENTIKKGEFPKPEEVLEER